jgi:hypothetical protein
VAYLAHLLMLTLKGEVGAGQEVGIWHSWLSRGWVFWHCINNPPQGWALLTYYVWFYFHALRLHLPQVGNFDIFDHKLCPKGVDFDIMSLSWDIVFLFSIVLYRTAKRRPCHLPLLPVRLWGVGTRNLTAVFEQNENTLPLKPLTLQVNIHQQHLLLQWE